MYGLHHHLMVHSVWRIEQSNAVYVGCVEATYPFSHDIGGRHFTILSCNNVLY